MTLEEQLEAFDRYAHLATTILVGRIVQRRENLIELARSRMSGIGVETYGSTGWDRPPEEAAIETDEELADAIVEAVREANTNDITFTGPVTVDVGFHFTPPKRISITKPEPVYDGNPGDVDKLSRAVLDALTTSGIIHDDKQVALLLAHKHWNPILGNETRIAIKGQAPCD